MPDTSPEPHDADKSNYELCVRLIASRIARNSLCHEQNSCGGSPLNPYAPPDSNDAAVSPPWLTLCLPTIRFTSTGFAVLLAWLAATNSIVFTKPTWNIVRGIVLAAAFGVLLGTACYGIARRWRSDAQIFPLTPALAVVYFLSLVIIESLLRFLSIPRMPGVISLPAALVIAYCFGTYSQRNKTP